MVRSYLTNFNWEFTYKNQDPPCTHGSETRTVAGGFGYGHKQVSTRLSLPSIITVIVNRHIGLTWVKMG